MGGGIPFQWLAANRAKAFSRLTKRVPAGARFSSVTSPTVSEVALLPVVGDHHWNHLELAFSRRILIPCVLPDWLLNSLLAPSRATLPVGVGLPAFLAGGLLRLRFEGVEGRRDRPEVDTSTD
jgi:hypothetical protein